MFFKKLSFFFILIISATNLFAADELNKNEHQLNFFTGNFDFSDHKQKAVLVGLQHQNENLNRETFLGNVSPYVW